MKAVVPYVALVVALFLWNWRVLAMALAIVMAFELGVVAYAAVQVMKEDYDNKDKEV